jgi:hypothetical protein
MILAQKIQIYMDLGHSSSAMPYIFLFRCFILTRLPEFGKGRALPAEGVEKPVNDRFSAASRGGGRIFFVLSFRLGFFRIHDAADSGSNLLAQLCDIAVIYRWIGIPRILSE